jgi:serine/threonine-protein kinase
LPDAVRWWRRLHQETAFSTRSTIGLARALDAAGERDQALAVAEAHAAELGAAAKSRPELTALLADLKGPATPTRNDLTASVASSSESIAADLSAALGSTYRIEGRIARSRLYEAFRARQAQSGRLSIIKVLDPSIVRYGDRRTLLQQLERAATLEHEYLAGFDTVGTARHLVYLVGPDDEGEILLERVRQRGELAVSDALLLARQVGSGLAQAHTAGVLHLDLTPKRILVRQRSALVRDTGLVSAIRAAVDTGGRKTDDTDVVLGTPAYMSPELLRAQGAPTERSDLFSFAAILYYALTGAPPYGSSGAGAQARPVAPSAASVRPTVPPALDAALQRALAPLRSDRQTSIDEFLSELPPS